jgi:hypothetical protein
MPKHEDDPAGKTIFMGDVGVTPIDARDDKEKQRFIIGEREELVMRCVLQVASLLFLVFYLGLDEGNFACDNKRIALCYDIFLSWLR